MSSLTTVNQTNTPRVEGSSALRAVRQHSLRLTQFLAVAIQFGLIVLAVDSWQLESQLLARVMWLAFAGFIIHHFLPLRFGFRSLQVYPLWQLSQRLGTWDPMS